jgi:hypothetical protein
MTPPPATDAPAAAARRLRRAIRAALLQRAAWGALVFGLLLAGGAFLALRVAAPSLSPLALLPWAALPVGVLFAAVAIPALRRLPSEARCLAAVEASSRAGGLALCSEMPGAAAWAVPETIAPAVRFRPSRALAAALPLAAAFCALSLALPSSLFEKVLPAPPDPTGIRALAAREESRLEDLLDAGALDEKKAAELREWLEQVREGAEKGDASQAALLEALDHVSRKLDDAALAAASEAVAEQNALLAAEGVASALADAAEAGRLAPEGAAAAPAALSDMLQAMPLSPDTLSSLSSALPSAANPSSDSSLAAHRSLLLPELLSLLSKLPPESLAALADALCAGEIPDPGAIDGLSLREQLDLDRMLSSLDPAALAKLGSMLRDLTPEALARLAARASGSCPGGAGEQLPPEMMQRLAEILSQVSPETLATIAQKLSQAGGGGAPSAEDAPELSLRDLLALQEMLEDLTPEALYDLASLLSKLSPESLQKFLGGGAGASGGAAELMTPEEFRQFLAALHEAWKLSSNELERLMNSGGPGCSQCKRALMPGAGAALDALLQQAQSGSSAAAAAAAACLGLCPGSGGPGGGGPHAPLGFTDPTPPAGPEAFHDTRLRSADGPPDPSSGILVGVSAGDPEVSAEAAPVGAGALDPAASSTDDAGATRAAPVLPRHRKAIESYFGDEP